MVNATCTTAWAIAASVLDPEVPVLTIEDLGILRSVDEDDDGITVTITPTYSGCPAMDSIRDDILAAFHGAGRDDVRVEFVLSPAWTTDWMSDAGKRKLLDYGIVPPQPASTPRSRSRCPSGARSAGRRTPASCPASAPRRASRCGCARPAASPSTTSRPSE